MERISVALYLFVGTTFTILGAKVILNWLPGQP
jgi:hypothetical protein